MANSADPDQLASDRTYPGSAGLGLIVKLYCISFAYFTHIQLIWVLVVVIEL